MCRIILVHLQISAEFLFGPPVFILLDLDLISFSVLTSHTDWSELTTPDIGGPPRAGKPGKPHGWWECGPFSLRAVSPRSCRGSTVCPWLGTPSVGMPYQLRGESLSLLSCP
jgi:hypothetical protein